MKAHVDYSWDEKEGTLEQNLRWDSSPQIKLEVVVPEGPGGGWPVVEVSGTETAVTHWLALRGYDFDSCLVIE